MMPTNGTSAFIQRTLLIFALIAASFGAYAFIKDEVDDQIELKLRPQKVQINYIEEKVESINTRQHAMDEKLDEIRDLVKR